MRKLLLLSIALVTFNAISFAQQLPLNTCGIVNIYDAAGNRTKRTYFCNNGTDPYPSRAQQANSEDLEEGKQESKITKEYQHVDALYPNPTTGKFSVSFSKELKKATVSLTDLNGKVVAQFGAKGYKIYFDLSIHAAGTYFVRIEEEGNVITKKVVKQ